MVALLYGSQTGTAEDLAERLKRLMLNFGITVRVVDSIDSVPVQDWLEMKTVIFLCSTTGQGEEPDNMKRSWKYLLQSTLSKDYFSGLSFAVFALGDSKYEKFCYPGKKLYRRLIQLGAEPLLERADGDDQHPFGLEVTFEDWSQKLITKIAPAAVPLLPADALFECPFALDYGSCPDGLCADYFLDCEKATVVQTKRLTAGDHFQNIIGLRLSVAANRELKAGSVAVIWPQNKVSEVQKALETLKWTSFSATPFKIVPKAAHCLINKRLGCPADKYTTLFELLVTRLDLFGKPRRSLLELMPHFTENEQHRDKLKSFLTKEGSEDLLQYCYRPRRTAYEVLCDFDSVHLPLERIIEALGTMRPRSFSLASAPCDASAGEFDLAVAIVNYKTNLKLARTGVCSEYVSNLSLGSRVNLEFTSGIFQLPVQSQVPIICIATGTGIAPMRSLLQARARQWLQDGKPRDLNYLFHGCRFKDKDALYYDEFTAQSVDGFLRYFLVASRDAPRKTYVQDVLEHEKALIWDLISNRGAIIYVSGNSETLPSAIKQCILRILETCGDLDSTGALNYFKALQKAFRYQEECW